MASVVLMLVCIGVFLFRCYKYMFERPKNFPPGPPKIPIFGTYLFMLSVNYKHLHRATETLGRWYNTTVLGLHTGSGPCVTVHDLDTSKEALSNPDLDGRPYLPLATLRDPLFKIWGIFFKDGLFWRNQRRFTLRHLRDFGFGRRFEELEIHIDEELRALVDLIKSGAKHEYEKKLLPGDGLVSVPHIFSGLPANLLLKILVNERLGRQEMEVLFRAGEAAIVFQRNGCMFGRIFTMLDCLKYIIPNWSGYNAVRNSSMELHGIVNKIVQEQYKTFDTTHERHFLDLYFKQILEGNEDFSIEQITHTVVDFIFPALSAISTVLAFALQRLMMNPDCMEKCQRQIDEIVGNGRLTTLDDRVNLPYVEASLRESMRVDTMVAINVPHMALRDTKVGDYDVPKGSQVLTILQLAHTDEKYFKDARTYRPERFLSANGKLNLKLDPTMPFGAGKRLCAGETFARNTLFLVLCTVLQHFNVSVPDGQPLINPESEPLPTALIKSLPSSYLKFTSR